MNGAAAHWLILARSSGSESELSAIRFSTYSFAKGRLRVDFRILGTLPRGEQIAVETDRPLLIFQTIVALKQICCAKAHVFTLYHILRALAGVWLAGFLCGCGR